MNHDVRRLPVPAIVLGLAAGGALIAGAARPEAAPEAPLETLTVQEEGFEPLLRKSGDAYHKGGWNHYGPGHFLLDPETGVLESHGGMGLLWYSARKYSDFVLDLEFKTSKPESNSGVFVRIPDVPTSDEYIYSSFEVQIHDTAERGVHRTGAVYDAEAATHVASKPTGEWNQMRIAFVGSHVAVTVNGETVVDWDAEPRGKVRSFASRGYIGLQNHDRDSSVWFRNLRIKDLGADS